MSTPAPVVSLSLSDALLAREAVRSYADSLYPFRLANPAPYMQAEALASRLSDAIADAGQAPHVVALQQIADCAGDSSTASAELADFCIDTARKALAGRPSCD